jgi:hypothetical protein
VPDLTSRRDFRKWFKARISLKIKNTFGELGLRRIMKKWTSWACLFFFLAHAGWAENEPKLSGAPTIEDESIVVPAESVAIRPSGSGRVSFWQNWTFAGAAIILAAVGIAVTNANSGHDPSGNDLQSTIRTHHGS